MDDDVIQLDIVEQEVPSLGLRPWIVIESLTGEIIDSEDVLSQFFNALRLAEGSGRVDVGTLNVPMGGRREVKLRRRG
jgi:hypothetical protein